MNHIREGKEISGQREFVRLSLSLRIQHMALFSSVLVLIVTGLPQKYAYTSVSQLFFRIVGGVVVSGIIHRVAAGVLIGVGVYHMFYVVLTREGRSLFRDLLPTLKDFGDVGRNVLYFFGFAKERARFGRFSYLEKFDYWAVYWGMVIMICSGLMLWFHEHVLQVIPKLWLDIAREAHSDEALLATLAIFIWHFYNVHFNPSRFPMSMTWWTGKISEEEMMRDHPLEYQRIIAEESQTVKKHVSQGSMLEGADTNESSYNQEEKGTGKGEVSPDVSSSADAPQIIDGATG